MTRRLRLLAIAAALAFTALAGCRDDSGGAPDQWEPPRRPPIAAGSKAARQAVYVPFVYDAAQSYEALVTTSLGRFRIAFYPAETPHAVETFLSLAANEFYDGLIVHRVVPDTIIHTGDPEGDGTGNPGYGIQDESTDRPFVEGTVGLARNVNPHSAGCQWFVCLRRLPQLDRRYAAFGHVTEGLDVVRQISRVPVMGTNAVAKLLAHRPVDPPVIERIEIIRLPAPDTPSVSEACPRP